MPTNIWYLITYLGDPLLWLYLSAVLVLMYFVIRDNASPRTRASLKLFLLIIIPSLAISLGTTSILKDTLQIPRSCVPCAEGIDMCNEFCPQDPQDYTFPSGHATTGFVAYTSLFLLSRKRKYLPIFLLPVLVALSRFFLGVHTITDILAGSVLGFLVTLVVWRYGTMKTLNRKR